MKKLLFLLSVVFLASCLIPENFNVEVDFKPDASFVYRFDGTVVSGVAMLALVTGTSFSEKEEAQFAAEAKKIKNDPMFKKLEYVGNGRYRVECVETLVAGKKASSVYTVFLFDNKDGTYTLKTPKVTADERKQLTSSKIKLDGKIDVKLPSGAQVISHNASSTPGFFSKVYSWSMNSESEPLTFKFKLKS